MPAAKVKPLARLCGLETEYAIHFPRSRRSSVGAESEATHRTIFDEVAAHLSRQIPLAPPQEEKIGFYLANGCAIWFETHLTQLQEGLLEVATPECHGPTELTAASRGVDQLLMDATESIEHSDVRLLKNCIDSRGNYYGAQENYEVDAYDADEWQSWELKMQALKALSFAPIAMVFVGFALCFELLGLLKHVHPLLSIVVMLATMALVFRDSFQPRVLDPARRTASLAVQGGAAAACAPACLCSAFRRCRCKAIDRASPEIKMDHQDKQLRSSEQLVVRYLMVRTHRDPSHVEKLAFCIVPKPESLYILHTSAPTPAALRSGRRLLRRRSTCPFRSGGFR